MTQKELIMLALQRRGYVEVPSKSRKYIAMEHNATIFEHSRFMFLGKAGAVRACDKNTSSNSVSILDISKRNLIAEGTMLRKSGWKP